MKNIFQHSDFTKLSDYLNKNQNIEPFNKIIIAKNIALAYQEYENIEIMLGDIELNHFFINPDTLAIYVNDSNKLVNDNSNNDIKNVAYSAYEKLNSLQDDEALVTFKTDIYSITAIIIDALMGISPQALFNNAFRQYMDKNPNLIKQPNYNSIKLCAMKQYFGKIDDKLNQHNLGIQKFDNIALCAASYDRMIALKKEINRKSYLLSNETKKNLLHLCMRGLAIEPDNRPILAELIASLNIISSELFHSYLKCIANFIDIRMQDLETHFPGATDRNADEVKALNQMILEWQGKEVITKKQIDNLNQTITITLQILEKNERIKIYLNDVNKRVFSLEKKINKCFIADKLLDDDFEDIPLTEEVASKKKFNIKNIQEIPRLLKKNAQILSSSLLTEEDVKLFKKENNEVLALLNQIYKGSDFFASKINKINEAMNKPSNIVSDSYSKGINFAK